MTEEEKLKEELKQIIPADRESMEKVKEMWKSVGTHLCSLRKLEDVVVRISGIKRNTVYRIDR